MSKMDDTRTVIVCGGGLAGFSAALAAQECGASVTLIEKASGIGGTTILSSGVIWTIADFATMREIAPHGDPILQWLVYDGLEESHRWLMERGARPVARIGTDRLLQGVGRGIQFEPVQMIEALASRFRAGGGELRLSTALDSLLTGSNGVCGVRAIADGSLVDLKADAVVLATGGFCGNPELLTRYVLRDPDSLAVRANPWNTGDGFLAATAIGGGATSGLDTFYGHALAVTDKPYDLLRLSELSQFHGSYSLAINLRGERFADETLGVGEEILNQRLARQPHGRGFYIIDSADLDGSPMPGLDLTVASQLGRARAAGAHIVEADTLEALSRGLVEYGVPAGKALQTMNEYNQEFASGGRKAERVPGGMQQGPLRTPPFIAVAVKSAITFTMGGLRVDDRMRVVARSASTTPMMPPPPTRAYADTGDIGLTIGPDYRQAIIRGLHAAGCDVGNISHSGYVGGLAPALVTGRTAGREAGGSRKRMQDAATAAGRIEP